MKTTLFLLLLTAPLLISSEVFSGSVISQNQLKISSRYMGYIQEVNVNEGDSVDRGTLLYSIDSKEVDAMKDQVLLSLDQAILTKQMYKNQYDQVQLNLQRHTRLYQKNMVAKVDVENLQLQVNNLNALLDISAKQIRQLHVRLKNVEHQYTYLHIVAPTDGVIIQKNINQGDISIPGMPALIMADLEKVLIEAEVTEEIIARMYVGMPIDIEIPSLRYKGRGNVKYIIPFSNSSAHRFKIKIEFDHKKMMVYPGMYAKITLEDSVR